MRIIKVPSLKGYPLPITSLSPSQYTSICTGCKYSFLLSRAVQEASAGMEESCLLPPNDAAIKGTIIHRMYELRQKGTIGTEEEFDKQWKDSVKSMEMYYDRKYPSVFFDLIDYDAMYQAREIAMKMPGAPASQSNGDSENHAMSELKVKIDGCLSGKIDKVAFFGGNVEIIDFKTGKVLDENNDIKQQYIDQLNLYALMYEHTYRKKVSSLKIVDRDGSEIDVPFNEKRSVSYIQAVKDLINCLNSHVANGDIEQLASPSEEHCKYCSCKHLCKHYVASSEKDQIVSGVVIEASSQRKEVVKLQESNGRVVRLMKLSRYNIENFGNLTGKRLVFSDCRPLESAADAFIPNPKCLILELPEKASAGYNCLNNFSPEIHSLVKWLVDNNKPFDNSGGFSLLDRNGDILAEAEIGWKDKKIAVEPYDDDCSNIFKSHGFRVFKMKDMDYLKTIL